jgi:AraC-like DNA-binding protein
MPITESEPSTSGLTSTEIQALQSSTLECMGHGSQIRRLLDEIEHIEFFVKDASGAFMAANRAFLRRSGFAREEELIGLTDFDLHPPEIAKTVRQDDWRIMSTRQPLLNHVEALFIQAEKLEWYRTYKLPLMDVNDEVIGVMGLTHPCAEPEPSLETIPPALRQIVDRIREAHAQPLRVSELAKDAGIQPRRLHEMFIATYRVSPQQFILKTRVQAAMDDLLHTRKKLAVIAQDHGFVDHSAFTRHFRNITGTTPREFQQRQRLLPEPWQKIPIPVPTER